MKRGRISSLDGLRGVAALGVVLSHTLLASSAWGTAEYNQPIARSPLHILWSGKEMVVIFFVLSGYVLALPALKRGRGWLDGSYYPRRLLRLYLPVWVAIVLAGLVHLTFGWSGSATQWLGAHSLPLRLSGGLALAGLMHQPHATAYLGVLWSLKYEVIFSVLLPGILALVLLIGERRLASILVAAECVALIWAGTATDTPLVEYLPMFVLGSLLAFHAGKLPRLPALVLCIVLLTLGNWSVSSGPTETACACGAVLAVWLAIDSTVLSRRPIRWLGSRSYSLYLVHEPIVVTLAFALGGHPSPLLLLGLAIPLALIAADGFWRLVERRSTKFARQTGLVVSERARRVRTATDLHRGADPRV